MSPKPARRRKRPPGRPLLPPKAPKRSKAIPGAPTASAPYQSRFKEMQAFGAAMLMCKRCGCTYNQASAILRKLHSAGAV